MSSMPLPRQLVARAAMPLRSPRLPLLYRPLITQRQASNAPPNKSRLLEKPARFNPPSHPARLPRRQRPSYPGPPLSAKEKETQKTKQYPHMMPPEGTFLHWFLTNRNIHVWITMSILISLAFFTWLTNFLASTPYKDQLPPNNMFLAHPFAFIGRYLEVYKMHTEYVSAQTAEHRRQKVEDVRKRAEYRKAHGLDQQEGIFGGWSAREDNQVMGTGAREGGELNVVEQQVQKEDQGETYVDLESKKKPIKKWFGIW